MYLESSTKELSKNYRAKNSALEAVVVTAFVLSELRKGYKKLVLETFLEKFQKKKSVRIRLCKILMFPLIT